MPRGLDHIIHAVRDLDAAADFYRHLGFTVGARNRHPPEWGTENHIIQLPGFFIELLSVTKPEGIKLPGPRSFSFGAFNRDFLAHGDGLSMMVLASSDAKRDAEAFRAARVGDFDVFDFSREAKRPDGTPVKVAFSLAFAHDEAASNLGFFVCQQHYPENFWNQAFQKHANGVQNIAGAVFVADAPERHRDFLQAFTDAKAADVAGGFAIATPRGTIDVLQPVAFTQRFGASDNISHDTRLAALRFTVSDLNLLQAMLEHSPIASLRANQSIVIGAENAMGAVLVFESPR